MKYLYELDLFGKTPDLYYKRKIKVNSILGLVFTFIYATIAIFYFIFKFIRMIERKDVKFYDTYAFGTEIPEITITNEQYYASFTMGGHIDETLYNIRAQYVSGYKNGDTWNNTYKELEFETCKLEKFGSKYREFFKEESLNTSYCLKNVNLTLKGYSYLKNFSYINLQIRPCVNYTKDGRPCKDYNTILKFFSKNYIEFKIQDNLLTPDNYKSPVKAFKKDIQSPIFLQLYQKIYSYIQIVRVETDEDIYGVSLKPKNKIEVFTKYQNSIVISAPGSTNILKTGEPACDITLQLDANVLTQTRYYTTLLDVMGEVGGLMQFLYSFFSVILSFRIKEIYERSLVNDLFSFNKSTKVIICKKLDAKKNMKDLEIGDDQKLKSHQSDTSIYKENSNRHRNAKSMINPLYININKDLKKKDKTNTTDSTEANLEEKENPEKNEIIDNINKACLFFRTKKRNIEKVCFEEGKNLLLENLDITNLFVSSLIVGKNLDKLSINKDIPISEKNRKYFSSIEDKINALKTSSESGVIK
jgi:hypothetical protein